MSDDRYQDPTQHPESAVVQENKLLKEELLRERIRNKQLRQERQSALQESQRSQELAGRWQRAYDNLASQVRDGGYKVQEMARDVGPRDATTILRKVADGLVKMGDDARAWKPEESCDMQAACTEPTQQVDQQSSPSPQADEELVTWLRQIKRASITLEDTQDEPKVPEWIKRPSIDLEIAAEEPPPHRRASKRPSIDLNSICGW